MANDTLELECPSCSELLELDRGFAGGVCRCFNCGTMMTVPNNPSREKAEKLVRPDAPGAPAAQASERPEAPARPDSPTAQSSDERPEAPAQEPPQDEAAPAEPESQQPESQEPATTEEPAPQAAAAPAGDYVTESGKTVHVDSTTAVPTARKRRMGVRAITLSVVILLMLLVVGGTVGAVVLVINSTGGEDLTESRYEDVFGYDPDVNPFTLDRPNVLGLPLSDDAVIVLDTSRSPWLPTVVDGLIRGLKPVASGDRVAIALAKEGAPTLLPGEAKGWSDELAKQAVEQLREMRPVGRAELPPAVQAAVEREPGQIILITGQVLYYDQIGTLESALKDKGIKLEVISVGTDNPELAALAESHGGRLIEFSPSRLNGWYRQWQDEMAESE